MSTIHPSLAFLDCSYHVPVDDDSLVLSLAERNSCYPLAIIMARRGGGLTIALLQCLVSLFLHLLKKQA